MNMMPSEPALLEVSVHEDKRGVFLVPWERERGPVGFSPDSLNFSRNRVAHTLRGFHHQTGVNAQARLVSCVRGRVWDVALDVRPDSPSRGQWTAWELKEDAQAAAWIPPGFSHAFLTLEPDTILAYLIAGKYCPSTAAGVRWDDPDLGIPWPALPAVLSERDRILPRLFK
jgi:dTDP-4-dehydrorhamnose 3,5-epimerase